MEDDTSTSFSSEQKPFTVDDIKEAIEIAKSVLDKPIVEKIEFSSATKDDLRKIYYNAFEQLPQQGTLFNFGGIPVVESNLLISNMMVIRFSNKTAKIFFYKDGKLYEFKNQFEYLANKRIEIDNDGQQ